MEPSRADQFSAVEAALGCSFGGELRIGGNYVPALRHGDEVWVSGQVPRVGNEVVVTGRVGTDVTLADAQRAAKICAMRTLALLPAPLLPVLHQGAEFMIIIALTAIGLSSDLRRMAATGFRPILLGLGVWAAVSISSLAVQVIMGQL